MPFVEACAVDTAELSQSQFYYAIVIAWVTVTLCGCAVLWSARRRIGPVQSMSLVEVEIVTLLGRISVILRHDHGSHAT